MNIKIRNAVSSGIQIGLILLAALLLFQPDGRLRVWLGERRDRLSLEETVKLHWDDLTQGSRLDQNPSEPIMVVFGDYECPFCRVQDQVLRSIAESERNVGIVYRHFPLSSIHPRAREAAAAAICAGDQGAFLSMHERLFESSEWQVYGDWREEAEAVGIPDVGEFLECISNAETVERVDEDRELAKSLGIRGTPTFVFKGGQVHEGAMQPEDLLRTTGH